MVPVMASSRHGLLADGLPPPAVPCPSRFALRAWQLAVPWRFRPLGLAAQSREAPLRHLAGFRSAVTTGV